MWYSKYEKCELPRCLLLIAALVSWAPPAAAKDTDVLQQLGCTDCHAVAAPAPDARSLGAYASRKGPDFFYAGSKYRPEFLRAWLAKPTPIRPAGLHPAERTRTEANGDMLIDAERGAAHPVVPAAQVDAVVSALQHLEWGKEQLPKEPPAKAQVPRALAEMNFVKFKGCGSCHRTGAASPPVSGPDLFDAYARLRPEFLTSYVADPQAWDPVAPMPGYALPPAEVAKLVAYLRMLSEDDHDAK